MMESCWNRKQGTSFSEERLGGSWACLPWGLQLSSVQGPQHSLYSWLEVGREEGKGRGNRRCQACRVKNDEREAGT